MSKLINILRKIIQEQCANNMGGDCICRDKRCLYFDTTDKLPRCWYLEEYVLPYEPNNPVRVLYYATLEAEKCGHELSDKKASGIMQAASKQIECERCKKMFKPNNNRQMYCERCSKIIRREHQRKLMQSRRKTKDSVSI